MAFSRQILLHAMPHSLKNPPIDIVSEMGIAYRRCARLPGSVKPLKGQPCIHASPVKAFLHPNPVRPEDFGELAFSGESVGQ